MMVWFNSRTYFSSNMVLLSWNQSCRSEFKRQKICGTLQIMKGYIQLKSKSVDESVHNELQGAVQFHEKHLSRRGC